MDDASFLKALGDSPADETVRLVYADWLEERGDPRGAYVRIEHEMTCLAQQVDLPYQEVRARWRLLEEQRLNLEEGIADMEWLQAVTRDEARSFPEERWVVHVEDLPRPLLDVVATNMECVTGCCGSDAFVLSPRAVHHWARGAGLDTARLAVEQAETLMRQAAGRKEFWVHGINQGFFDGQNDFGQWIAPWKSALEGAIVSLQRKRSRRP